MRYFSLFLSGLCFFIMIFSLPVLAADKYLDIQAVEGKASGVKAWLVEDHSIPVIAMSFSFRDAGTKNDPVDKQGLARLVSNTMDEGAGELDAQGFQKQLQDFSISLSFNVDRDHFGGSVKTLSRNRDRAFDLLRLALTKPRFEQEALDRMRAANLARIRSSLSDPGWIAARLQNDRIFEGHSYALNSGGTLSSLPKITTDDLRGFHKGLGKNGLVISVAGDISAEELSVLLDITFGDLPDVPQQARTRDVTLTNPGKMYLFKKDMPQTLIEIVQPGIGRDDPDFYPAQVMDYILGGSGFGSRLMEEMREKRGLTYGVYTYFQDFEDVDTYQISTSTANQNVGEVLSIIREEWENMRTVSVRDKELSEAKAYLIGSLPLALTSTDSIAGVLLSMQMDHLPMDYLDKRADQIKSVSAQDIQKAAKKLLMPDALTTILVGMPGDDIVHNTEIIESLPNAR